MAIGDNIKFDVDTNSFKAFSLGKGKANDPTNLWNKDNLAVRAMAKSIYHFSATKQDILPRLVGQEDKQISNADVYVYKRIGKAKWVAKKKAGETTPFQDKEVDQRAVVPTILHTATVEDIDYHRKGGQVITAAYQLEQMYALSRVKELLAQFGATQDVINLTDTMVAGYAFGTTSGTSSIGDDNLIVCTDDPTEATAANIAVGGINRGGTSQAEQDFLDDLTAHIESKLQRGSDYFVVGDYSLRRQLQKIKAFRDLESTQAYKENEYGMIMRWKGLTLVFLLGDTYHNQKTEFNNKYVDKTGFSVKSATGTGLKSLGSITASNTPTYKTLLVVNRTGSSWAVDDGAIMSAVDVLPENSFAKVQYMKTGYAFCRKDEAKVHLVLYKT